MRCLITEEVQNRGQKKPVLLILWFSSESSLGVFQHNEPFTQLKEYWK